MRFLRLLEDHTIDPSNCGDKIDASRGRQKQVPVIARMLEQVAIESTCGESAQIAQHRREYITGPGRRGREETYSYRNAEAGSMRIA